MRDLSRRSLLRSSGALIAGAAAGALSAGAVVAATPAHSEAASDPLLSLIVEYRQRLAVANATPDDMDDEAFDEFYKETVDPWYRRLKNNPPAATTEAGALAALRLAYEEMQHSHMSFEEPLIGAAVAFFDGRA